MSEALKLYEENNNHDISKYIIDLESVDDKFEELYREGFIKGYDCGFVSLYEHYSILPGKMTFIVGSPAHGKTYFWFECLINLSQFHGLKHLIFSPEMGDAHEIYADLAGMAIGKKFQSLNAQEMKIAKAFLQDHFKIIDCGDEQFTLEDWFVIAESEKPDTLTGDPFNEFTHDFRDDYNRQDLYIERQLGFIRRKSKALNIHTCIITHARDQRPIIDGQTTYFPPPTAREYAGGQAWFRKGLGMICIWRPPAGLVGQDKKEYEPNETHVIIQKAKPRGVGKTGTVKLYLDLDRWRYYEKDPVNGTKIFAKDLKEEKAPF